MFWFANRQDIWCLFITSKDTKQTSLFAILVSNQHQHQRQMSNVKQNPGMTWTMKYWLVDKDP